MSFLIQLGLAVIGIIVSIYALAGLAVGAIWLFAKPRRIGVAIALSFMVFFTVTMLVQR